MSAARPPARPAASRPLVRRQCYRRRQTTEDHRRQRAKQYWPIKRASNKRSLTKMFSILFCRFKNAPQKFRWDLPQICGTETSHFYHFFATSTLDTAYLLNETSHRQTNKQMSIYNLSPKRWLTFRDLWPRNCSAPTPHVGLFGVPVGMTHRNSNKTFGIGKLRSLDVVRVCLTVLTESEFDGRTDRQTDTWS